ncbi:hypothetical protein [Janibacter cremeus]|uniref:Uncharacterized protein n=1 Tax=Janibacter cremeus TaxID=1285192 RepID=A0A852VN63_9MICO|nr:hypothetical protein [Janibacter cremeus]NYF96890.1 hypothetical protein [Janibacter cremeus]
MGNLATGGGSSAVAASQHAGCERFRRTDRMVLGRGRREIATKLGSPDTTAGIPEARWMRAMTFERLIRHEAFVSRLLTTTVGALDLARPVAVRRADAHVRVDTTATVLAQAHLKAVHEGVATMITSLAIPFVGLEDVSGATPVKPDFAVVSPRFAITDGQTEADVDAEATTPVGSWLVMGDAKDYERVRAFIDDQRMLKGFLQVALGAESVHEWSKLPNGMTLHPWGTLAVPRNAFLQPSAVVERLDDHRTEVRVRAEERHQLREELGEDISDTELKAYVDHLERTFNPMTCPTCSLFNYCRDQVRSTVDPASLLTEIGVAPEQRPALAPVAAGKSDVADVPDSLVSAVIATRDGHPVMTGQRRTDPVGQPATINLVLAKSDAAALGCYGVSLQRIDSSGAAQAWVPVVFADPQSLDTRLAIMGALGAVLSEALADQLQANSELPEPIQMILPDTATGDLLVSIADSLAGTEISRLRWARDLEVDRPPLTFDGEPASVPDSLTEQQRLAVSFLLDQDRGRALALRESFVDLRAIVRRHFVPGGVLSDAGRLDYLVRWAEADGNLDHRVVSDSIAEELHTPGARLSNAGSDAIHSAAPGTKRNRVGRPAGDYDDLVRAELEYKADVVSRAVAALDTLPVSRLRAVYRAIEARAQQVWRRRMEFRASDLVRFGRVNWFWRNSLVPMMDTDATCAQQLRILGNPHAAREAARDAGARNIALADVVDVEPVRLKPRSRRLGADDTVALILDARGPMVDHDGITLKIQAGSFKFGQWPVGRLEADERTDIDGSFEWSPKIEPDVDVGDEVVISDINPRWLGGPFKSGHEIAVGRPPADDLSGPKPSCTSDSFMEDPDEHQYCCQPHEFREANTSDWIAERRAAGEMNPEVWPPVVDMDQFDTPADGTPTDSQTEPTTDMSVPLDQTPDDLD